MQFLKVEGEKRNTYVYIVGEFGYYKSRDYKGIMYLKCKHYKLCDGTAEINPTTNLVEPMKSHTCGAKSEDFSYLQALGSMRDMAANSQIPLRQVYQTVTQSCLGNVKKSLTYPKFEQILQEPKRSCYSTNPDSPNAAIDALNTENLLSNFYQGTVTFEDQYGLVFCSFYLLSILSDK